MRRKDDEKEQRIRHAVIELMLQEGFNGTSIAKIARLAGVSPATVYIYYENKEEMLQDIYLEYSEEVFDYLLKGIDRNMSSAQMIETLIRRYYRYMTLHPEAFCFVEQFANCPSLFQQMQLHEEGAEHLSLDRGKKRSASPPALQRCHRVGHPVLSGQGHRGRPQPQRTRKAGAAGRTDRNDPKSTSMSIERLHLSY